MCERDTGEDGSKNWLQQCAVRIQAGTHTGNEAAESPDQREKEEKKRPNYDPLLCVWLWLLMRPIFPSVSLSLLFTDSRDEQSMKTKKKKNDENKNKEEGVRI